MFVYLSILFCLYIVNLIMSSFFSSLYYYYSFIILFFIICNRQRLSCLSFSSLSLFFRSISIYQFALSYLRFFYFSLYFLMYLKIFYTYFLHHRNPLIKKLSIFCRFKDEQKQNKHRFLIYNRKTNDLFFLRLPKYDL